MQLVPVSSRRLLVHASMQYQFMSTGTSRNIFISLYLGTANSADLNVTENMTSKVDADRTKKRDLVVTLRKLAII